MFLVSDMKICACVQGLPEAEPSGEVFKYSCQARSRLESILELRLEGLGKLTGSETFTYDLVIPASKQSALRNALQLVPLFGSMTDPSQPLRFFPWPFWLMKAPLSLCVQLLLVLHLTTQSAAVSAAGHYSALLLGVMIAMQKWRFVSSLLLSF